MKSEDLIRLIDFPEYRAEISAVDLTTVFLERIDRYQPALNALITVTSETALEEAAQVDATRQRGERSILDGLPMVVKDNVDVKGVRTTVGSKIFENNVAERDAEVVRRIRAAGGVILGKANLHELVFGGTTNNVWYGTCHNPWDLARIPGGSSGGSAVALAADLCIGAIGSDSGGSIRGPSSINGITGLRPSFGLISNRGAFPISCSLDTVGPMARSALDVARILAVMAGYDPLDAWAVDGPPLSMTDLDAGLQGCSLGVVKSYFYEKIDPGIARCVENAIEVLASLGATIKELEISDLEKANEVCTNLIRTEALALHRDTYYDRPHLLSDDTRRRLSLAEAVRGIDFADMVRYMHEWRAKLRSVFEEVDILVTPMIPFIAPRIADAEMVATTAAVARVTYPWSLAHLPAMSIPCGMHAGMPVGCQLATSPWNDSVLLRASVAYQAVTRWHRLRPPMILDSIKSAEYAVD